MKKIIMKAAVAAAVLTSCSNSELVELSDSRAIGFETYVAKPLQEECRLPETNLPTASP